jgi:putative two-component system response regulator
MKNNGGDDDAGRRTLILAVDDSQSILKTISLALGDDYKVFPLAKPAMLEKALSKITPELFLLDCNMPELSGFDLVPIIRSFEEHNDTPIIFLTSEGTDENISNAFMVGACDFVMKPIQPDVLRQKIARYIHKSESERTDAL